ncbi:pentapeptide repeat protein [Stanieria cyanosphaera PCC 7437]|uniref:Pentapeptide repeat protein n=1 Tax=Stanieria cyanosphaera (strain ATCC 29371 / PCC 7437) TaxID=111780 RepID=K9XP62_STAC7|nr:pentapeptide repeat-containing protein [Stanieria cyanosphaera]AFZ34400.1 pentapeptide repeat protein [Stanieria cyanosphaera PCC 7437]
MIEPPNSNSQTDTNVSDESTNGNQTDSQSSSSLEHQTISTSRHFIINPNKKTIAQQLNLSQSQLIALALVVMGIGLFLKLSWLGIIGSISALLFSLGAVISGAYDLWLKLLTPQERKNLLAFLGFSLAIAGLLNYLGVYNNISDWLANFKYDEFGSWAEWIGALGQISIAILAVYVAWAQYVISRDLTIQQNRITQQQTIDAYFQGISDLALSEEGLLEDWPQERAIAEGRTAAIMSSVDASGKAKILRFLSQARLLTPLKRDSLLGRAILDGSGSYAEDRPYGVRVIDLGVILAGANLAFQDLRWTDLSEANMVRTNLTRCDLVKANLSRTILYDANLSGADLKGTRLFYGSAETASPRSRTEVPNYETGEYTGAVIERVNFTEVRRLSEEQRYYICAWGGEKTRMTIPGGCEGIPNLLGR